MSSREKTELYSKIIKRAEKEGVVITDKFGALMDVESADIRFNLRLEEWLTADAFNFMHDWIGIQRNIDRTKGFPAKDFGWFIPRFAGAKEEIRNGSIGACISSGNGPEKK